MPKNKNERADAFKAELVRLMCKYGVSTISAEQFQEDALVALNFEDNARVYYSSITADSATTPQLSSKHVVVTFYANGNTSAFYNGVQVPELQESWFNLYMNSMLEAGYNPAKATFAGGQFRPMWVGGKLLW